MRIGAHQSIYGGIYKSIERALHDECEAFQVFVKNANRWQSAPLSEKDILLFREKAEKFGEAYICAHSSYLINLASINSEIYSKSIAALEDELRRCSLLNIPYLVLHPGAYTNSSLEQGIKLIAQSIDRIYHEGEYNVSILLETTAGQGTSIGHKLEHLEEIISLAESKEKIGVCLDSCHMYSAGYDIVNEYDSIVGCIFEKFGEKIKVFHLNDTKKMLGSRVDRHELIGKGEIKEEFFIKVINDHRFKGVLGILETPIGKDNTYLDEIKLLKSYRKKGDR